MSRGRTLTLLTLTAIVLIAGWYWWSPRSTWDRFIYGITFGSVPELETTIDFAEVRGNFRHDVEAALGRRKIDGNVAGFGASLVDMIVGETLTAEGLSRLITGISIEAPDPEPVFRYRSPSRVDVELGSDSTSKGILTFTRSGLRWRLTRVWGAGFASIQGTR